MDWLPGAAPRAWAGLPRWGMAGAGRRCLRSRGPWRVGADLRGRRWRSGFGFLGCDDSMIGKRGRVPEVSKWAATSALVLLVSAWGCTFVRSIEYQGWRWDASLMQGVLSLNVRPWATENLSIMFDPDRPPAGLFVESPYAPQMCMQAQFRAWKALWPGWPRAERTDYWADILCDEEAEGVVADDKESALYEYRAEMPLPPLILLVGIPSAIVWYRERRRLPAGHCRRCGYDLTKNESGRCPECGTVCRHAESGEATRGDTG